ncbi:MAG: hypothetical protein VR74_05240 [Hyphomonas sp. BRH_c22]|uniref:hypothetical protein n=1 Tax=Hyphomonas sp. BRH_c22 TaxID=1629710 RepID=UPI0005F25DF8|nr:hypothetical protein [Hyphomonas sp. BRH_c22]KJS38575.1 MAG: hypothetical protein VR74_05240 [Hyphomonas sp. BRH_c22]
MTTPKDPHSVHHLTWQGIEIEVTFCPVRWGQISHIELRATDPERAPLPLTETGYLSHFFELGTIEANGGNVIAQVTAWLDEAAQKPEWLAYQADQAQGDLFK